jgi:hypothetical protein
MGTDLRVGGIDKFVGLEASQGLLEAVFVQTRDRLEERQRHLRPDDRSGLEGLFCRG